MNPSQDDPLYSPKRRLSRAKEHIRNLEADIKVFADRRPYTNVVELHADGVTQVHKFKLTESLPPRLSDLAADAIDNLRSVLDQTGYAAAVASGKVNPKSTAFPFGKTEPDVANTIKGWCKDIRSDITTLFASFKPHQGGNDLLWALNQLCNVNKHAIIIPMGTAIGPIQMKSGSLRAGPGFVRIPALNWDSTKHEMVFAEIGPGGHIEYDVEFAVAIVFGYGSIMSGQPAVPVLNNLVGIVESVLVATEAECRRLSFIK